MTHSNDKKREAPTNGMVGPQKENKLNKVLLLEKGRGRQAENAGKSFQAVMASRGILAEEVVADGELHRCGTADKPGSKNGWYKAHDDSPASIAFGNWRTGESWTHCLVGDRELTPEDRSRIKERAEREKAAKKKAHKAAKDDAVRVLLESTPAPADHPYFIRKGVVPVDRLRVTDDGKLVVPILDAKGAVQTLQFINGDGEKKFLPGGKAGGGFFPITAKDADKNGPLFICEGLATGLTIHAATEGGTVLAAMNCGNLMAVAKAARGEDPGRSIIICADDDAKTAGNPGLSAATDAARRVGGLLAVPIFPRPNGGTDFNDLAQAEGVEVVATILNEVLTGGEIEDRAQHNNPEAEANSKAIVVDESRLAFVIDEIEADIFLRSDLDAAHRIYQRGPRLVRIAEMPETDTIDGITRQKGSAVIMEMDRAGLHDIVSRYGQFKKWDSRKRRYKPAGVPKEVGEIYLSRCGMWSVSVLRGVVGGPCILPTGRVVSVPGYDAGTRYYFSHDLSLKMPVTPTMEDARAAIALLTGLLSGFPFVEGKDVAVALAQILTVLVRPALPAAPLFSTTAPTRGSGKSELTDVAAAIGTGRRCSVLAAAGDPVESEKRIISAMLSGDQIISLDNVNGILTSNTLCQGITASSVSVRPLGVSRNIVIPNTVTWFANGNNITLAGDLSRRAILCRLDPGVERPEERVFPFDPVARAIEHRADYVSAALTIIKAYIASGSPDMGLKPFCSFEAWCKMVRNPLVWAGCVDPCDSRDEILASDPDFEQLEALVNAWWIRFEREPRKVSSVIQAAADDDQLYEALNGIAGGRGGIDSRRVGYWLRGHAGRIAGGKKFVASTVTSGVAQWQVVRV